MSDDADPTPRSGLLSTLGATMLRAISSFKIDEQGDWVALLTCGHGQHVRHRPPFEMRPWVLAEEGRQEKLGQNLGCPRCDRLEIPEGYAFRKRTPTFTEESVPPGLLANHRLKPTAWGRIVLEQGSLTYSIDADPPQGPRTLTVEVPGIIPPQTIHRLALSGPVRRTLFLAGSRRLSAQTSRRGLLAHERQQIGHARVDAQRR